LLTFFAASYRMDDSIQLRCSRCNSSFRDRARRIQNGYARECPNCNVLIFFESESHDEHIKHALKAAHKLRRALAQAEEVKLSPNEAPEYNRTS
jgi:DNA-directed RNA polymerase subunit RPC12/RpoP